MHASRYRALAIGAARIALLSLAAIAQSSMAQDAKLTAAKTTIEQRIALSGADVAVYFRTLDGKAEYITRPDEPFHAASTMKVPVMIELFHQVQQGKLRLEDQILVRNDFHSMVDGSSYSLSVSDDSEGELYKALGQPRTLVELCELMITVSSNLATNLLIEKLGVENIRATVHGLGADGVVVLRGVEDGKAFAKGLNNLATARGLAALLEAIAAGKAVDARSSEAMVAILERQKFNEGIPAGLPRGVAVAHKTGEITKIHHDAAIVFAKRPYVLVVMVRGLADQKESAALMSDISRELYESSQ